MKTQDMKITTRILMSLGTIFILVALIVFLVIFYGQRLVGITDDLYNHPFTVTRAIGSAKSDILSIKADTRAFLLAASPEERSHFIHTIEASQADAEYQLGIVAQRYLGAQADVAAALAAIQEWENARGNTIAMFTAGNTAQAIRSTTIGGELQQQAADVLDKIQIIANFSNNEANEFYENAQAQYRSAFNQFLLGLGGMGLVLGAISYWFVHSLREPLDDLMITTNRLQTGDLSARSSYKTTNEFGVLAEAFNALAASQQADHENHEHTDILTSALMRSDALPQFCANLMSTLAELTGSQIAAMYLLSESNNRFELAFSLGLNADARQSFSAEFLEGEFGRAQVLGGITRVTEIPPDTHMRFSAVSGDYQPREVITIPLHSGKKIVAFISLAALSPYSVQTSRFLDGVRELINTRANEMLVIEDNRNITKKLEEQNAELNAQSKELVSQAAELQAQNAELEVQKHKLDEASRLKSSFLSNMSHELRTPLNSVIALSGVLNRRLKDKLPPEDFEYLDVVERNAQHLLTLINDILDLSRIEAGKTEITLSQVSPAQVVGEIITMLAPQAEQKGIVLKNKTPSNLPSMRTDRAKCLHILQNLIGNAIKFTEQGDVLVNAHLTDEGLEISVCDTGIGISPEQIPFIFDEFRQGDESAARKYEGTGLGLAIAKKYALILGGDIEVESTPDQGSTFTLRLPDLAESTRFSGAQQPAGRLPSFIGMNILVVEDNPSAVIQIQDALHGSGARVVIAANGIQALESIQSACPQAVILDLNMPEMDGFEFLAQMRAQECTCKTPVLILTARQVSKEELSFLKGNNIFQLVRKGEINREELQALVGLMFAVGQKPADVPQIQKRKKKSRQATILLVENDADNMRSMRALLGGRYKIIEATDCNGALAATDRGRVDLVLTDLSMPDGECTLMLEKARKSSALKGVPIVAVTAHAMHGDRERILALGFDGYVAKPVDVDVLDKTLQELMHAS